MIRPATLLQGGLVFPRFGGVFEVLARRAAGVLTHVVAGRPVLWPQKEVGRDSSGGLLQR